MTDGRDIEAEHALIETTPGERLRARRRALKISAAELGRKAADAIGRVSPISPSAVRNHENGTNGIPMSVARGYAEVLKVDPSWILFGDYDLAPSQAERAVLQEHHHRVIEATGELALSDIHITTYGIVSATWLPVMVKPDHSTDENELYIFISGWAGTDPPLIAYEVADTSLDPVYPKGTWLIAAREDVCIVQDGTHVIAARYNHKEEEIYQAVREVRGLREGGVDLVGIGQHPIKPEPLVRNGEAVTDAYVDEVIIATFRALPGGTGPSLELGRSALHRRALTERSEQSDTNSGD
jgi:transcriptional regulator with XRE-family HTH domain